MLSIMPWKNAVYETRRGRTSFRKRNQNFFNAIRRFKKFFNCKFAGFDIFRNFPCFLLD